MSEKKIATLVIVGLVTSIFAMQIAFAEEDNNFKEGQRGEIGEIVKNIEELDFWLHNTVEYQMSGERLEISTYINALGGEGIELLPGSKLRQCYIIKDGKCERLEKALDTRFYRSNNYTESFPRNFDYIGIADFRGSTLFIYRNPFINEVEEIQETIEGIDFVKKQLVEKKKFIMPEDIYA